MEREQLQRYDLFTRVREFGLKHESKFPATSMAGKAFATVTKAAAAIERQRAQKEVHRRLGGKAVAEARRDLRDLLTDIVRTARETKRGDVGSDATFRLPRKKSDAALIEAAHEVAAKGGLRAEELVRLGLPATALADLQNAADRLQRAIHARKDAANTRREAGVDLERALADGFDAVKRLDTIVANVLKHDEALLTVWHADRRLSYRSKSRSKTVVEPPAAAPAAAPAVEPAADVSASPPEVTAETSAAPVSEPAKVVAIDDTLRKVS